MDDEEENVMNINPAYPRSADLHSRCSTTWSRLTPVNNNTLLIGLICSTPINESEWAMRTYLRNGEGTRCWNPFTVQLNRIHDYPNTWWETRTHTQDLWIETLRTRNCVAENRILRTQNHTPISSEKRKNYVHVNTSTLITKTTVQMLKHT